MPFQPPYGSLQIAVVGYAEAEHTLNVVWVLGSVLEHNTNLIDPTRIDNVSLDRELWRDYTNQVRVRLGRIKDDHAALQVAEPIGLAKLKDRDNLGSAPGKLLVHLKAFLSHTDLLDYAAFGFAMGQRGALLGDGFVRDMVSETSDSRFTVGVLPGPSLLDGLPFTYRIYPSGTPDSEHRLPPYHRLVAQLDIGFFNHPLQDVVCIRREELEAAFGASQPVNVARSPGYVRKIPVKLRINDTIYASFGFNDRRSADGECAQSASFSQYRQVTD